MTDEMERQAEEVFAHLLTTSGDGSMLEGVYAGIENGYFLGEIADAAYRFEREVNAGRRIVVGVNAFTEGDDEQPATPSASTPTSRSTSCSGSPSVAAERDDAGRRGRPRRASPPTPPTRPRNLMPALIDAVRAYATEGEIVGALEAVFGTYIERIVV